MLEDFLCVPHTGGSALGGNVHSVIKRIGKDFGFFWFTTFSTTLYQEFFLI